MKAVDYKGKHFILVDDDYELDEEWPEDFNVFVDADATAADEGLLRQHVESCDYYGIPVYIGDDRALHDKIKQIQDGMDVARED